MKKLIYLFIVVFFYSCTSNIGIPENRKIYYKFTSNDFENVPTKYSQIGNINVYKNSGGESISIKNDLYRITENTYLNGEIFGTEYYYDQLFIRLKFTANSTNNNFDIEISKYEANTLNYKITTQNLGQNFSTGQSFYISFPQENNLLVEKVINNILFKKVKVIELDQSAFLNINNNVKINKIYFDLNGGIIGLEDSLNNNQFWISN